MDSSKNNAFKTAVELTKTKLQSSNADATKTSGKEVVEFFNEVYKGLLLIIEKNNS